MDIKEAESVIKCLNLAGEDWEVLIDALTKLIPISATGISIDGGGILGIGPVSYLARLGYNSESFLSGTSTGALIVALRGVGHSWEEILKIFKKSGASIFDDPGFMWNMNPMLPKYNEANLEKELNYYFGDKTMDKTNVPIFITASDFKTGKPKVFDSISDCGTVKIKDAVRCSTAAPTYFAPVGGQYADGGLWANNPVLVGLAGYCHKTGTHPLRCRTLSFGTGGDYWKPIKISKNMSKIQWANPVIEYSLHGTEEGANFIANALLGSRRFNRIEPKISKEYHLDSIDAMVDYEHVWSLLEVKNRSDVWRWLLG